MALFSDKKNPPADEREDTSQIPLSFTYIAFLIFIFGVCLSCILSIALKAGRFIEYKVPLFLMEFPAGIVYGMGCFLFLAVLAGLVLQKTLNTEDTPKSILSRSQKISYFFSLLTTLGFTAYLCAVLVHALKTGQFLSECLYIVFLYACVLAVHFKAKKSSLAHMFTTAAFILILVVTAFYGGIAAAKIAYQNVTSINGEMYTLVSAQKNNYILVGFDTRTNKSNGKIIILPKQSSSLEQIVFFPFVQQKR